MRKTTKQTCSVCGNEFDAAISEVNRGNAKTCSRVCAAKRANEVKESRLLSVNCANCGTELKRNRSSSAKNFYCNTQCKKQHETGERKVKRKGINRRDHLRQKQALLDEFGVVCQFPGCTLDLLGNRKMVDMHHFGDSLDHNKTKLLCPYHHRLADLGFLEINGAV